MLDLKKEGLIKEIGVSNFDPFKFDAMNKAVDGALVTNQIEWNPVCFEHFNSGMMDYLTVNKNSSNDMVTTCRRKIISRR